MATTQCPECGLTVPYFCCEGLVCPACGYDEGNPPVPEDALPLRQAPETSAASHPHPETSSRDPSRR